MENETRKKELKNVTQMAIFGLMLFWVVFGFTLAINIDWSNTNGILSLAAFIAWGLVTPFVYLHLKSLQKAAFEREGFEVE